VRAHKQACAGTLTKPGRYVLGIVSVLQYLKVLGLPNTTYQFCKKYNTIQYDTIHYNFCQFCFVNMVYKLMIMRDKKMLSFGIKKIIRHILIYINISIFEEKKL